MQNINKDTEEDDVNAETPSVKPTETTNSTIENAHALPLSSNARPLLPGLSLTTLTPPPAVMSNFEVNVSKETFKFNAAHFVAYPGFRERLHGHNYQVSLRLLGSRTICNDGYLLDFGDMKKVVKDVCQEMNEYFLCPTLSDVIQISIIKAGGGGGGGRKADEGGGIIGPLPHDTVKLVCEDGATFLFPRNDCLMLPIVHATTEELAIYLWGKILTLLDVDYLRRRGIHTMQVTVAEAPGQDALFRMEIPPQTSQNFSGGSSSSGGGGGGGVTDDVGMEIAKRSDVRRYISSGDVVPRPCLPISTNSESHSLNVLQKSVNTDREVSDGRRRATGTELKKTCGSNCNCENALTKQLQALVNTLKNSKMLDNSVERSVENLQDVIDNQV